MKIPLYDDQLIVITGASGLLGSNVVRCLNDQGYFNLLLVDDIKTAGGWRNLWHKRFVDLVPTRDLFHFLQGRETDVEAFIHLGGCVGGGAQDGDLLIKENYRFSVDLVRYALPRGQRFIYVSTASTYGDGRWGCSDEEAQLDRLEPPNLYSFSKHMFDKWIEEQEVWNKVVGLKLFTIFGPNEWHASPSEAIVRELARHIQERGVAPIFKSERPDQYEDGEQCYDFYYVKDAARMIYFFLKNDVSGLFNVGSGETHTWKELASALFAAFDKPERFEYSVMPREFGAFHSQNLCADLEKLHRVLKENQLVFCNQFTFSSAIGDYVHHHLIPHKYQ